MNQELAVDILLKEEWRGDDLQMKSRMRHNRSKRAAQATVFEK